MSLTAQQKATEATNSFIRDFCERHEECAATRTEAYDRVSGLEKLADEVRVLIGKHVLKDDWEFATDGILATLLDDHDERYLAVCMVSALREKEDEVKELAK